MTRKRYFYPASGHRCAYFRRPYPKDVQAKTGLREFKKSLGAGSWIDIEPRYVAAHAEYLALVRNARASAGHQFRRAILPDAPVVDHELRSPTELTAVQVRAIAVSWFASEGLIEPSVSDPKETPEYLEALQDELAGLANDKDQQACQLAASLLMRAGYAAIRTTYQFQELCGLVQSGLIASLEYRYARAEGRRDGLISDPLFASLLAPIWTAGLQRPLTRSFTGSTAPASSQSVTHTFDDLLTNYREHRIHKNHRRKTQLEDLTCERRLRDLLGGHTPVADIDYQKCREVLAALQTLPRHARQKARKTTGRGLPLIGADEQDVLVPKTINKYMKYLTGCLEHAKERLRWIRHNPAKGLTLRVQKTTSPRSPYEVSELNILFATPLFTAPRRVELRAGAGSETKDFEDQYWIVLIALFSGMRETEICQLDVADIIYQEGIAVIRNQEGDGKSFKTPQAIRDVPVHPELTKLGFMEFVERRRRSHERKLFPSIKPGKTTGIYGDAFSKFYSRYLARVELKKPSLTFHSFRHGVTDALRERDVPQYIMDRLMGWKGASQSSEYGNKKVTASLYDAVCKIEYAGLVIPRPDLRDAEV